MIFSLKKPIVRRAESSMLEVVWSFLRKESADFLNLKYKTSVYIYIFYRSCKIYEILSEVEARANVNVYMII